MGNLLKDGLDYVKLTAWDQPTGILKDVAKAGTGYKYPIMDRALGAVADRASTLGRYMAQPANAKQIPYYLWRTLMNETADEAIDLTGVNQK